MWTEEEAKTKVCPHMRHCLNPYQVRDGEAAIYEHSNCLGSACMAWRWNEDQVQRKTTAHGSSAPAGEGWTACEPDNRFQWWARPMPNRQGRCGLAGDAMLTMNTEPSK